MLSLEVLKICEVLLVLGRLLVLGQVRIVLLLCRLSLCLVRLLFCRGQGLPVLANQFGDLGKCQVAVFEVVSRFCQYFSRLDGVSSPMAQTQAQEGGHTV